jgi:hypothetical protein
LLVIGSSNIIELRSEKTIVPMLKPISRDGHNWPSKAVTRLLTEYINMIDIGIPIDTVSQKLFFNKSNLS